LPSIWLTFGIGQAANEYLTHVGKQNANNVNGLADPTRHESGQKKKKNWMAWDKCSGV